MTHTNTIGKNTEQSTYAEFSPAFIHGVLSAYCCQEKYDDPKSWQSLLLPDFDEHNSEQKKLLEVFIVAKATIHRQLQSNDFVFALPDCDDDSLSAQVLATREWASGFWLAVEQSQLAQAVYDTDATEFIGDLQRIAAMPLPAEDEEENPDNQADLIEIQEYCRMGVIGLFLSARTA